MKKRWILYVLVLMTVVFFSASQALASPVDSTMAKKNPQKTPGAQATERAIEKAAERVTDDSGGNGKPKNKQVNLKGTVVSVDEDTLVIDMSDTSTLSIAITEDTRIHIPTLGKEGKITDLLPGVKVGVRAFEDEDGLLTAISITVIPGKPIKFLRVGIVTEYIEEKSITIEAKDGKSYTFVITKETKILPASRVDLLAVGVRVTIIAPRDVTGGKPTARGIVIHPTQTTEP